MKRPADFSPPFFEREEPLALLASKAEQARQGRGSVVLVRGEAGVGKSTLVRRSLAELANIRVLHGACEALLSPHPLAPLHDIARGLPELRKLLGESVSGPALWNALLDMLGDTPTLLLLEDIHWADAATLDLIRYVSRRLQDLPVMLLLTLRDEDAGLTANAMHALADMGPHRLTQVPLRALTRESVLEWARRAGRDPEPILATTCGNPLYISEVLANADGSVPASVRDSLLARTAQLPTAAQDVLAVTSLVPRSIETWLLRAMVPDADRAALLCVNAGVLVEEADGASLRFRHELARLALAESMPRLQARELHERLLRALRAPPFGVPAVPPARLVHHAWSAGDVDAVLEWAQVAAQEAVRRGARREAVDNYQRALTHAVRMTPVEQGRILMALAEQSFLLNLMEEAAATLRRAAALFESANEPALQATALARLAMPLVRMLKNAEADAVSHQALMLARSMAPTAALAEALAVEAYLRMLNRDSREAEAHAREAISWAERLQLPDVLVNAWCALGASLLFTDYPAACEALHKSRAMAEALPGCEAGVAEAWLMLGSGSGEVWELPAALEYLEEGIAFAGAHDLGRQGGYMLAWAALAEVHAGLWEEAEAHARSCLEREPAHSTSRIMALVALARLQVRRGEAGARELLDEALHLAQRSATLQRLAPVHYARAEMAWLGGEVMVARAEIMAVLPLAIAKQHAWFAGEGAMWMRRLGEGVEESFSFAEPWRLGLQGRYAEAAEAWLARKAPFEAACMLAEGNAEEKLRALELWTSLGANAWCAPLRDSLRDQGQVVPRGPRAMTRAHPGGLTRREQQILELLASGMQNRQIAEALSRSVRTVDHHVAAVLEKLEAGTRAEAVARARERGWLVSR